ncbi:MAG TPA: hypothetical protein VGN29_14885 [Solirubrobacteraceae bacterium]|jgi:hypothetical protein|nr:hypothetical protein [Solirubrobacteraceae bacterium]
MPYNQVHKRLGRVLLAIIGVIGAFAVAVSVGAIRLPGAHSGTQSAQARALVSPDAKRSAATMQWASATCTSILGWKNELQRDAANLDLGLGALPRIQDAITATTSMLNKIGKLGLPPSVQNGQARADAERLRTDLQRRVRQLEDDARSVASGNIPAIATLLSDLKNDRAVGPQMVDRLRQIVSVDLGLSVVQIRACQQLIGISS